MEQYKLKSKKFMAVQLTNENIHDVFVELRNTFKVYLTINDDSMIAIHTKPYTQYARLGQYIAIDEYGNVLVRNEKEFNDNFRKI